MSPPREHCAGYLNSPSSSGISEQRLLRGGLGASDGHGGPYSDLGVLSRRQEVAAIYETHARVGTYTAPTERSDRKLSRERVSNAPLCWLTGFVNVLY